MYIYTFMYRIVYSEIEVIGYVDFPHGCITDRTLIMLAAALETNFFIMFKYMKSIRIIEEFGIDYC